MSGDMPERDEVVVVDTSLDTFVCTAVTLAFALAGAGLTTWFALLVL